MVGERPRRVLVLLVAHDLGQVLHEVTSERHVQDLRAAADGQNRHVARERRLEQGQLAAVALRDDTLGLRVRFLAVHLRVEVRAAGEHDPVEDVQRLLDPVVARRHEQRPPARALDRVDVVHRDERRVLLPDAESSVGQVRGDPDDRLHYRPFCRVDAGSS